MFRIIKSIFQKKKKPSQWICRGGRNGKKTHLPKINETNYCQLCGLPRSGTLQSSLGLKRDKILFATLTILNIGSGVTTVYGALQIFPGFVGYFSGFIIQIVLFLLVSGSTARHAPRLKWIAICSFATISIYTSFFAYYDTLVGPQREIERFDRAVAAHQEIVSDVYTPLRQRKTTLNSEISVLTERYNDEISNVFGTGATHGPRAEAIYKERETKQRELIQVEETIRSLEPLFNRELTNKSPGEISPEEIYRADIQALAAVPKQYLPPEYQVDLNRTLRVRYLDPDTRIKLLEPFLKVSSLEPTAISAILLALMVDGLIIALGSIVEIRDKKIPFTLTLLIDEAGSTFLEELLESIDASGLTINTKRLQDGNNWRAYLMLMETMRIQLQWLARGLEEMEWRISSASNYDQLIHWLVQERERFLKLESKKIGSNSNSSSQKRNIKFFLPPKDSDSE